MKRALITGGQQGIGLGIARALHGAGFQIALTAELPLGAGPAIRPRVPLLRFALLASLVPLSSASPSASARAAARKRAA